MARFADPQILQRVAEVPQRRLLDWKEGVSLEQRSARTLEELRHRSTADRLELAAACRRRARLLVGFDPPLHRDAISRFYYATYHALRAVVYFTEKGDDHNGHTELQQRVPDDFPNVNIWKNNLKIARETRNRADYDLYPKSDAAWASDCQQLERIAADVITAARSYLRAKGCSYL